MALDFDVILKQAGDYGTYQKVLYVLICLPASFPCAWFAFNQVFVAAVPPYSCKLPKFSFLNWTTAQKMDLLIPKITMGGETFPDPCSMYNITEEDVLTRGVDRNYSDIDTVSCSEYVFDNSTYISTIATEFQLYCEQEHFIPLCTTMFYLGSFIGNILFGYIGDKWGRRPAFFIILTNQVVCGLISAFSPDIYTFTALRFFGGMSFPALYQIPFIVGVEFMGPEGRLFSGLVVCLFFAVAMCTLGLVAGTIREWSKLTIVCNAPFAILMAYWWILPESPRWQVIEGRTKEATDTLMQVAKYNSRRLDRAKVQRELDLLHRHARRKRTSQNPSFCDLFKTTGVRRKTIILTFVWLVNALVYNGLTYNVTNLGVSDYLSFTINGVVEIPAYFLVWPLLDRLGRRWLLVIFMLFGGVACVCCIFVPEEHVWVISGLAFFGKFGNAASFAVLYIFAGELYPTVLRALGMGFSSMVAGLALILAPYLINLGQIMRILPLLIMGGLTVAAGIASMFLPETTDSHLPQTIEDAEAYGKNFGFWYILPRPEYRRTASERFRLASLTTDDLMINHLRLVDPMETIPEPEDEESDSSSCDFSEKEQKVHFV